MIAILAGIISGIAMGLFLIYCGPPKNKWCNKSREHSFGEWSITNGPSSSHYYQARTCTNCKYTEVHQEYIGMMK